MRIELRPLGIDWVDGVIGGIPLGQPSLVVGPAKSGKTCVALGFAIQAMEHAPVCLITSDVPESVFEFGDRWLGRDFRPDVRTHKLIVLSLAPFFESKLRSAGTIEAPIAEISGLLRERGVQFLIIDTINPFLAWGETSEAKRVVRELLTGLRSAGVTTLLTATPDGQPQGSPLHQLAGEMSGAFELGQDGADRTLVIRSASWARIEPVAVRFEFVQRRGIRVVGENADAAAQRALEHTDIFNIAHLAPMIAAARRAQQPSLVVIDSVPPQAVKSVADPDKTEALGAVRPPRKVD